MEDLKYLENPGCLTLPEERADVRDFKAEEAIELDESIKLPESFSLGKRVYSTNYQGAWGSCTSNSTCHGVQILDVKKKGEEPTTCNISTPSWRDLRVKMGHNLADKNDSGDYVEKAVSTALKEGIHSEEGELVKFDGYSTQNVSGKIEDIKTKMKRYLYNGNPIVWTVKGNKYTRADMTLGELKRVDGTKNLTGGHAICICGRDKQGFRALNSRSNNDKEKRKSRFHIPYTYLKDHLSMFNRRYRVLFNKEDVKKSPEYLKKKGDALVLLKALREVHKNESDSIKIKIEQLSKEFRLAYPELNDELPIN